MKNPYMIVTYLCNIVLDDGTVCGTMEAEEDGVTCRTCGNVKQLPEREAPKFGHSTLK